MRGAANYKAAICGQCTSQPPFVWIALEERPSIKHGEKDKEGQSWALVRKWCGHYLSRYVIRIAAFRGYPKTLPETDSRVYAMRKSLTDSNFGDPR